MKICSYLHVRNIFICRMFPEGWTDFKCLYSRIYLIWHPKDWRGATELSIPFIKQYLYWPKFLPLIFALCLFIPYVVNNPIFYGALTLRRLMSYIYGAPILDISRSHATDAAQSVGLLWTSDQLVAETST